MLVYCITPSRYSDARKIIRTLLFQQTYPCKIKVCIPHNPTFQFFESKLKALFPDIEIHYGKNFLEVVQNEPEDAYIMWGYDQVPTRQTLHRFMEETATYPDSVLSHSGWNFLLLEWVHINYHAHNVRLVDGICMTRRKNLPPPTHSTSVRNLSDYWFQHKIRMDIIEAEVKNHYPITPLGMAEIRHLGVPPVIYKGLAMTLLLLFVGFKKYPRITLVPFLYLSWKASKFFREFHMNTHTLAWWVFWFILLGSIRLPIHVLVGIPLIIACIYSDRKKHWFYNSAKMLIKLPDDTYIPKFKHPVIYVANYPADVLEHGIYSYLGDNITLLSSGKMQLATSLIDTRDIIYIPTEDKKKDNYIRTLRIIKAQFDKNYSVFAYPENHYWDRNSFYEMCRFRTGLFRIAKELNTPIVPVVVGHFDTVLGFGDNTLKIQVLDPLWVEDPEKDTELCYTRMSKVLNRFKYI